MSFQFLFFSILCSSSLVQIVISIAGFDGLNHKRACKKHYCAKGYVAVPLKHLKLQAGGCDSLTNSMGGSFGQNDNSKRALEPCCNLYVLVFANFFSFLFFFLFFFFRSSTSHNVYFFATYHDNVFFFDYFCFEIACDEISKTQTCTEHML